MPSGNYGTSGLSGISAELRELPTHDEELVTVVEETRKPDRTLTIVSPVAGKDYCFDEFERSLGAMPTEDAHVWLYCNSPSGSFFERVQKLAKTLPSFTLMRDLNQPLTIENCREPLMLSARCAQVYEGLYERVMAADPAALILNLEDDIGATTDHWSTLFRAMESYPDIGAIIADCRCRRTRMMCGRDDNPLACNFRRSENIGGPVQSTVETLYIPPKRFGLEKIGGGHQGLWLARRDAVEAVGMKTDLYSNDCPEGHDFQFGYRLNRQTPYHFVIDWSARVRHMVCEAGRVASI